MKPSLREILRFQLYFVGKSNVPQVKLMLFLLIREIIWYELGMVKLLNSGYGVMC